METICFNEKGKSLLTGIGELQKLATGYFFTEGPVWDSKLQLLYFTDFDSNTIHTWHPQRGLALFRENSGRAVGLSLTRDGQVLSAETKTHAVTLAGAEKSQVIAGQFQDQMLNSPNDVVARSDGSVFFTDPYSTAMGDARELPYNAFYCLPCRDGVYDSAGLLLLDTMDRPNGIAFSPKEDILYVNDTNQMHIRAYQMRENNTVSYIGIFGVEDAAHGSGAPDGMKVDMEGNVYVTGPGGIWVFTPEGVPAGILKMPEFVGNLCFGGMENRTLFITASTSVYRVEMNVPGIIPVRV